MGTGRDDGETARAYAEGGRGREGVTPAAAAGGSAFISRPDQAANLGFEASRVRGFEGSRV